MSNIRRISLYGGPGSGKSTLACCVFSSMKMLGLDVEHVTEYIKMWAYMGRKPESFDQLFVFANQMHNEDVPLRHCGIIVSDSPLMLNAAYSAYYGCDYSSQLVEMALLMERKCPSLNFFIDRTVQYQQNGRYQSLDEAVKFDNFLKDFLETNKVTYHPVQVTELDSIMNKIKGAVHAS